ncbi:glycosyltransferase [uncultured Cohaesibacter sp.]|uniref:glycosyltransferase family 2 protein n=1 Tax=uncultured Cohaesibacter sp. TaxID=1002546 RepID=UPI0029C826E9|nr:glycosyltransferase [uncultured Cohaesibacter sp.]
MSGPLADGIDFLSSQSLAGLLALYWFVLLFEVPRYAFSFLVAAFVVRDRQDLEGWSGWQGRLSVIIAGHNEEGSIERCARSLWEQSLPPDEIVVISDGSTDNMARTLRRLQLEGIVQKVHCTQLRAGKSAATNLAERLADGDVMVNVDCDCSFDRHALRNIVAPLIDEDVAAVSGNILIRSQEKSLWTAFQAIEYLISISLGKRVQEMLGQVTCASGAFAAFRTSALRGVGGLDAGGGEDLDVTLRLRRKGWKIAFGADAICYTDPPQTATALIKQRFRWERDAVRLRYRKHVNLMNPFSRHFQPVELLHELEFLIFNVFAALALPFYLVWLFATYGDLALPVLIGAQCGLLMLDLLIFLIAGFATPQAHSLALIPFVLGYSLFYGNFLRVIRLLAYGQEWVFRSSYRDSYVPDKVHDVRE